MEPRFFKDFDLVRHIRDTRPTIDELLEWLGPSGAGRYYNMHKIGLLINVEGRLVVSPDYLSLDGKSFRYYNYLCWLDENRIDVFCGDQA